MDTGKKGSLAEQMESEFQPDEASVDAVVMAKIRSMFAGLSDGGALAPSISERRFSVGCG